MKKTTLALAAVAALFTSAAHAQSDPAIGLKLPTQKGSWMAGTNLLMSDIAFGSTSDYSMQGTYNVSLNPRAAYFIKDNLAIGGTLSGNFTGSTAGWHGVGGYHSKSVGLGVFARQYFGKAAEKDGSLRKLRFFAEAGVTGYKGWNRYSPDGIRTEKGSFSSASFHVMPGFNYFLNKNVALEGGLNISHTAVSGNAIGHANRVGLNLGLQIFLGK